MTIHHNKFIDKFFENLSKPEAINSLLLEILDPEKKKEKKLYEALKKFDINRVDTTKEAEAVYIDVIKSLYKELEIDYEIPNTDDGVVLIFETRMFKINGRLFDKLADSEIDYKTLFLLLSKRNGVGVVTKEQILINIGRSPNSMIYANQIIKRLRHKLAVDIGGVIPRDMAMRISVRRGVGYYFDINDLDYKIYISMDVPTKSEE